jgi:hypothetical protein
MAHKRDYRRQKPHKGDSGSFSGSQNMCLALQFTVQIVLLLPGERGHFTG